MEKVMSNPLHKEDGWYFCGLSGEYCQGPFDSQEEALWAFKHYCETSLLEETE